MDLSDLASYGRSPTWTAWATNPIRRTVWWLVGPFFRGAGVEIDLSVANRLEEALNRLSPLSPIEIDRHVTSRLDEAFHRFSSLVSEEADRHATDRLGGLAAQVAGLRKDAMAVAHRLAGLEEEAASAARLREDLAALREDVRKAIHALNEHSDSASAQIRDARTYTADVQKDLRAAVQVLNTRIDPVSAQAREASVEVAGLRQTLQSAVESLHGRVDSLARGAPLRAGDRMSVGEGGLVIVATAGGSRFLVRRNDLIGHLVAEGREWEPHVRVAIERAARPDGIAIDAGAYVGLHTITMSRCFRTVHAFEPQRGIFHILCANLALNNRMNVAANNVGLYDRAGSLRLAPRERQEVDVPLRNGGLDYDHLENAGGLTFDFIGGEAGDVPAIALDDMALNDVALIKVDTQGADLRVLRGAIGTIRRCQPVVLFEWERDLGAQHGAALDDFQSFFAGLEYDMRVLEEITPGRQVDYIAQPRC